MISSSKKKKTSNHLLDTQNDDGEALLHKAAENNDFDSMELLISAGVDVNLQNKNGDTALHIAIKSKKDNYSLVAYLAKTYKTDVNLKNKQGNGPIHLAAKYGKIKVIQLLLGECRANVNLKNFKGEKAIHIATEKGFSDIVKYIKHNESRFFQGYKTPQIGYINRKMDDQRSAIHYAVKGGSIHKMKYVIEMGADLNLQDCNGDTALHYAARKEDLIFAKFLVLVCEEKSDITLDITLKNKEKKTAIDLAIEHKHNHIANFLSKVNKKNSNVNKILGLSALHRAAFLGDATTTAMLLKNGEDANARDKEKRTPLHYAIFSGDIETMNLLTDHGVDINAQDKYGNTPIHYALLQN